MLLDQGSDESLAVNTQLPSTSPELDTRLSDMEVANLA